MRLIKILLTTALLFGLTGCTTDQEAAICKANRDSRSAAKYERVKDGQGFNTVCIDNVKYIKYYNVSGSRGYFGLTVKMDANSKVITCVE